jgi:hypothetical protein
VNEAGDEMHMQIVTDVLAQVPFSINLNFGNITPK